MAAVPEDQTNSQVIIKEGWLVKEGLHRKSWKKRWFVLRKGVLSYSKKMVCPDFEGY